jgi:acyl-CoA reductase-like NAD-dependent aldehyde dehydrogenase
MTAIDFAEVLHASDVPGGVVNIITGYRKEFLSHAASHMDVNGSRLQRSHMQNNASSYKRMLPVM